MEFDPKTLRHIEHASEILRSAGLVALPTETVYGLCARADDQAAVARIFVAKGRPNFNPLISHVRDLDMAEDYVTFNTTARQLAQAFWPGALTLVLPRKSDAIASNVSAGLETLAIRAPAHPIFQAVIERVGVPIAAPSANLSGRMSPTTAEHVRRDLANKIDAIVDGGPTLYGLESTVVLVDGENVTLLRHGAISQTAIEACIGRPIAQSTHAEAPISPGQLLKHYAPKTPIILNAKPSDLGAIDLWLGFNDGSAHDLSPAGDLQEAAHNLFQKLSELDEIASKGSTIYIAPIPQHGIGAAINDRLNRAAQSGQNQ